jgi:uncharacterized phiE125 gp8 family phage protein
MSYIKIKTKDYAALPTALLPKAKAQARVDGSYDDAIITDMIARAIDLFERETGVSVFVTQYEWAPDQADFCNNVATIPFSPVNTMTAKDGANVDVSSSYSFTTMSQFGVMIYKLNGAWIDGVVFTIESGYAAAALPPGVLDVVMRVTAHLYDNREILVPGTQMMVPDFLRVAMATYWMPHV